MNAGFSPDERSLIGVSGGRDSVALLHQLHAAGFRLLTVCHLDHSLRAGSENDARFVERLASRLDYDSVVHRESVTALAKRRKLSLESAAREARYAFFARVARDIECPRLFLAHHADDQVETFLFNLFRGAAAAGLAGMSPNTTRVVDGVSLRISRPLLGVWREEIDAYIARHKLEFVEDASNADLQFSRNRLRHEIIPALEKSFGREIRSSIWRTAEILRAEDQFFSDLVDVKSLVSEISVPELQLKPLALQRRVLHLWLRTQGVPDIGFAEVEAVRSLMTSSTAKTNLPGGWHARRRARKLFLESPAPARLSPSKARKAAAKRQK